MTKKTNSIIMIQNEHLEWIIKHPERFVNNLVSRLTAGELDKYPGYARWNGDGIPGVQVAWIGQSDFCGVVVVGNNCATRIGTANKVNNDNSVESKEEILRQLAVQLGFTITKNKNPSKHKRTKKEKEATVK